MMDKGAWWWGGRAVGEEKEMQDKRNKDWARTGGGSSGVRERERSEKGRV